MTLLHLGGWNFCLPLSLFSQRLCILVKYLALLSLYLGIMGLLRNDESYQRPDAPKVNVALVVISVLLVAITSWCAYLTCLGVGLADDLNSFKHDFLDECKAETESSVTDGMMLDSIDSGDMALPGPQDYNDYEDLFGREKRSAKSGRREERSKQRTRENEPRNFKVGNAKNPMHFRLHDIRFLSFVSIRKMAVLSKPEVI